MARFVALLRGVNVGKSRRVNMVGLRGLFEQLGYTGVSTLLNSGNVVFQAAQGSAATHAAQIAAAMLERLEVEVPVIVKTGRLLSAIVAENPIVPHEAHHSRFLVAFTQDAKSLALLSALSPLVTASERFALGRNAAYLHCADGILESKAGAALAGKLGREVTARNWATVLKLHAQP